MLHKYVQAYIHDMKKFAKCSNRKSNTMVQIPEYCRLFIIGLIEPID